MVVPLDQLHLELHPAQPQHQLVQPLLNNSKPDRPRQLPILLRDKVAKLQVFLSNNKAVKVQDCLARWLALLRRFPFVSLRYVG